MPCTRYVAHISDKQTGEAVRQGSCSARKISLETVVWLSVPVRPFPDAHRRDLRMSDSGHSVIVRNRRRWAISRPSQARVRSSEFEGASRRATPRVIVCRLLLCVRTLMRRSPIGCPTQLASVLNVRWRKITKQWRPFRKAYRRLDLLCSFHGPSRFARQLRELR